MTILMPANAFDIQDESSSDVFNDPVSAVIKNIYDLNSLGYPDLIKLENIIKNNPNLSARSATNSNNLIFPFNFGGKQCPCMTRKR